MKIVFCDFDGVLNSHRWMKENAHLLPTDSFFLRSHLDFAAVGRLEKIVKAADAKVVVSSTWRLNCSLKQLQEVLKNHGFTGEVIGVTPYLGTSRGNEIAKWLNENGPVEKFIIIDDDSDMVHLKNKLVQTSWDEGLLDEHIAEANRIFEL